MARLLPESDATLIIPSMELQPKEFLTYRVRQKSNLSCILQISKQQLRIIWWNFAVIFSVLYWHTTAKYCLLIFNYDKFCDFKCINTTVSTWVKYWTTVDKNIKQIVQPTHTTEKNSTSTSVHSTYLEDIDNIGCLQLGNVGRFWHVFLITSQHHASYLIQCIETWRIQWQFVFLPREATRSAVLPWHVVRPSVCLSVRLWRWGIVII